MPFGRRRLQISALSDFLVFIPLGFLPFSLYKCLSYIPLCFSLLGFLPYSPFGFLLKLFGGPDIFLKGWFTGFFEINTPHRYQNISRWWLRMDSWKLQLSMNRQKVTIASLKQDSLKDQKTKICIWFLLTSQVANAQKRPICAFIYRTFSLVFSDRHILRKPFSRRRLKMQAREHQNLTLIRRTNLSK